MVASHTGLSRAGTPPAAEAHVLDRNGAPVPSACGPTLYPLSRTGWAPSLALDVTPGRVSPHLCTRVPQALDGLGPREGHHPIGSFSRDLPDSLGPPGQRQGEQLRPQTSIDSRTGGWMCEAQGRALLPEASPVRSGRPPSRAPPRPLLCARLCPPLLLL